MGKLFSFAGMTSGSVFQFAYVVPDADASMRFYAETLGIGPFSCSYGFRAPDGWYRGSTAMPELTLTQAYTGRLFIELIQQHDDTPSVYKEFIEKHGYGLHHLGIAVATEDFDKTLERYFSLGFENIFTDNLPGGTRVRYIGPNNEEALEKLRNDVGVSYLELVEVLDNEVQLFAGLEKAYHEWDGKTLLMKR